MNVRIHQGLVWIFAAAVVGAAGCASGDTGKPRPGAAQKPAPGRPAPGRGRRGETTADCFGPSRLSTAAREQLVDQICGAGGHRMTMASGGACASAYQVRSDAQIAGLLSAWNDAVIRESTTAEHDAVNPGVREVAHLLLVSHTRAKDEQSVVFARISIQPEATAGSRKLGACYSAVSCPQGQASGFDRGYVARQIEAENRSLQLVDALVPQARSADLRCSLEAARAVTEVQLDQACWVWSSIKGTVGTAQSAEVADEMDEVDESGEPGETDEEATGYFEPEEAGAP